MFTGRGYVRMYAHIWPPTRFASPGSLLAHSGSHGACGGGSLMGSGGHGYSGHVCYDSEGQPLRPGNGGLCLLMDRGLPVA